MDELRDIARLYDIYVLLGLDHRKKLFLCPLPQHIHTSNTPSFNVKVIHGRQRWICFGNCGKGGDVIDLMGYMYIPNFSPKNPEHIRMAAARLQDKPIAPPVVLAVKKELDQGLWRKYADELDSKVILYADRRGLTSETLKKFRIGSRKGAMAIPVFENTVLKAIKFRSTAKQPKMRYWSEEGSQEALFNYDAIAYTEKPVLIVKGEIPVMLLDQYGLLACCTTVGEGKSDISEWKHLFAFCPKIVVVTDNDKDPEVRKKMVAKAEDRAKALNAELKAPPEKSKDIDAWVLDDPGAIDTIKGWLNLTT
jgi:hypothetical protein